MFAYHKHEQALSSEQATQAFPKEETYTLAFELVLIVADGSNVALGVETLYKRSVQMRMWWVTGKSSAEAVSFCASYE